MTKKPTFEELEQRIEELKKESFDRKRAEEAQEESEKAQLIERVSQLDQNLKSSLIFERDSCIRFLSA